MIHRGTVLRGDDHEKWHNSSSYLAGEFLSTIAPTIGLGIGKGEHRRALRRI